MKMFGARENVSPRPAVALDGPGLQRRRESKKVKKYYGVAESFNFPKNIANIRQRD